MSRPDQSSKCGRTSCPRYRFIDLFSNVFRRHSGNEVELLFATGTPAAVPITLNDNLPGSCPHPWFYSRVLVWVRVLYLGFYVGLIFFANLNFLPGIVMLGAFLTPLSLVIFFWELNVLSNISVYRISFFFLFGGLVSLLYSVLLYSLVDGTSIPFFISVIEETAKLTAILIFAGRQKYTGILNGLLIGAAIGAGFAAFESSGYILLTALKYGIPTMLKTIFWRAILAPGGHIAWAALIGGAVMTVKDAEKLHLARLFHFEFLRIFIFVIVMHMLWDSNIPQPFLTNIPVYPIVLTMLSWAVLFRMIRKGIYKATKLGNEVKGDVVM